MSKSKTARPKLPLLIPSAPGEAGERAEFSGSEVRELSLKEARDMLAERSNQHFEIGAILAKVRLVTWHDRPALYLEDRTLAPYVRSFVRFKNERGVLRCPQCGNWFVQRKSNQLYDSSLHRDRHRVARWRASRGKGKKKYLTETILICNVNYISGYVTV